MIDKKAFIKDFERDLLLAEARALSKLSLEKELTHKQFERFKYVCKKVGIMTKNTEKGNVIMMCKKCGDLRRKSFQKNYVDLKVYVGDFVKYAFEDKFGVEHMWVEITSFTKTKVTGIISNSPVMVRDAKFQYGQPVEIKRNMIEDYMSKDRLPRGK